MKQQKAPHYDAGDFLELECYLSARHREGRQFQRSSFGGKLNFQSGEKEICTYRLDYAGPETTRAEFLSRAAGQGWSSCGKVLGWECLKKAGTQTGEAEEAAGLFHNALERGRWGRKQADREILLGVLPMAVFYLISYYFQDAAFSGALWQLTALFLVVAAAVALPAYRVRAKCGKAMDAWRKSHEAPDGQPPAAG